VFTLDEVESMLLEGAVAKANGNLSSAARLLGITRPQLAYRLKRMKEADKAPPEKQGGDKPAKAPAAEKPKGNGRAKTRAPA
jgi:hypothetical protein